MCTLARVAIAPPAHTVRLWPPPRVHTGSGSADVSEFVEKLGAAVGDDLKRVGAALSVGTSKLAMGMSAFAEALRR